MTADGVPGTVRVYTEVGEMTVRAPVMRNTRIVEIRYRRYNDGKHMTAPFLFFFFFNDRRDINAIDDRPCIYGRRCTATTMWREEV